MNGPKHIMYKETGFYINELEAYTQNGLISEIRDKVPKYRDDELRLNNYTLY